MIKYNDYKTELLGRLLKVLCYFQFLKNTKYAQIVLHYFE